MIFAPGAKRFIAVTAIALGIFWGVALVSWAPRDWPFDATGSVRLVSNYSGPLGSLLAWVSIELFGAVFAWLAPVWLFFAGVATLTGWLGVSTLWGFRTAVFVVLLNTFFALTPYT